LNLMSSNSAAGELSFLGSQSLGRLRGKQVGQLVMPFARFRSHGAQSATLLFGRSPGIIAEI
jgi:hypothetical protein